MKTPPNIEDDFRDELDIKPFRHMSMKDIDEDSRPREKLAERGAENLSIEELFAILIGSGTRKKNATELMREILSDCKNNLTLLDRLSIDELMRYEGIGEAKAITIKAALELCNRRLDNSMEKLPTFSTADSIYEYMLPFARRMSHEASWGLMLNNHAKLLKLVKLSEGGRTGTVVDVRILCKKAILAEATCVVLVHNHPSGSLRPSHDDDNLTQAVKASLSTLDIRLLDHVIVTDGGYYSYSEMGKL